ncbi:MAG TPA: hypothetical protein VFL66_04535 [Gaiellaceae bacterium]|nr:hypothetical protein [Gaiellaceae bacterium]
MNRLRTWHSNHSLARRLRTQRPEPSATLLRSLGSELGSQRRRSATPRIAFAGGLTAALLVALGALGGVGYAASSVEHAARAVQHIFVGQSSVTVSGLTAGGDQYRPGYGWGDPNHNHSGPPGLTGSKPGAAAPPAQTKAAGKHAIFVDTSIKVDEQASLWISIVNATGKKVLLTQGKGARVGKGIKGKPTKSIHYVVLVPRAIPLQLRVPKHLVKPGAQYRIRVIAKDPQGNKSVLYIPFTA